MEEGGEHWKGSGLFPQYPSPPAAPDTRIQSVTQHVVIRTLSTRPRTSCFITLKQLYTLRRSCGESVAEKGGLSRGMPGYFFIY